MRQYVIDELSFLERDNLDSYLKRTLTKGPMEGLYWLILPEDLYSTSQQGHEDCAPFYLGVEIERERLKFELLVRSNSTLHCDCIAHATAQQRQFVLDFVDKMLEEEKIRA